MLLGADSEGCGLGTGIGKSIGAKAASAASTRSGLQPACLSAASTSRRESPRVSASRTNANSSSLTAMAVPAARQRVRQLHGFRTRMISRSIGPKLRPIDD